MSTNMPGKFFRSRLSLAAFIGFLVAMYIVFSLPANAAGTVISANGLAAVQSSIPNRAHNVPVNVNQVVLTLGVQNSISERISATLYASTAGTFTYQKTLAVNWSSPLMTIELGPQLNATTIYWIEVKGTVVPSASSPYAITGRTSFTYSLVFETALSPVNGTCGPIVNACSTGTMANAADNGTTSTWTCAGAYGGGNSPCSVTDPVVSPTAQSKLGMNVSWINDWGDRENTFIDVMKNARGFATVSAPWDPVGNPAPIDANGWPTTDFGIWFLTATSDPLNRPIPKIYPSFFGTYALSFTGQATVAGFGCCTIQNQQYNSTTNTTTAQIVVGPTDTDVSLTFTNTHNGVQNIKLLRPGYALGTTQVFTNEFLNAVQPFSTLRFMDMLATNSNPVTSWATRTLPTNPVQSSASGVAWEYVIQLANASGKDIWINIPEGVNLTDPSPNNYITQLATLMKQSLDPRIHVYVEYSNELWNGQFSQTNDNYNSATSDVNSGADTTLNYDAVNNSYYWGYRRVVHQIVRISQLFATVYGQSAINTTIRPVYVSQFVQPYLTEDGLFYLKSNFGAPSTLIYAIGGAPYFYATANLTSTDSIFASLQTTLNQYIPDFNGSTIYTGTNSQYNITSMKSLATYYGLKSFSYEGGPDLSNNTSNTVADEQSVSDPRVGTMIQTELSDWLGCGNDLFMYYDMSNGYYGAYEDITIPTVKSAALNAISATPLSSFKSCQ